MGTDPTCVGLWQAPRTDACSRVWSRCFVSPTISYLLLQSKAVITACSPSVSSSPQFCATQSCWMLCASVIAIGTFPYALRALGSETHFFCYFCMSGSGELTSTNFSILTRLLKAWKDFSKSGEMTSLLTTLHIDPSSKLSLLALRLLRVATETSLSFHFQTSSGK